ncbi:hypothetical protein DPMN_163389 [Dreissena polymorpha]|uniref:Uncharacterized protein n=1 Tax=Dreissena polymorpha TaxID=45954 RepID=A0A9D4ER32_DREPO|nr:hypothetical protein DPMN_163389 [Dreissena polymorpha]
MSLECRENVVCRPSSATLDILSTFSRRTTNQSTVNMIYRENVACRPTAPQHAFFELPTGCRGLPHHQDDGQTTRRTLVSVQTSPGCKRFLRNLD